MPHVLLGGSWRTFTPSEKTHGLTESQRKFELLATSFTGLLLRCLFKISKPIFPTPGIGTKLTRLQCVITVLFEQEVNASVAIRAHPISYKRKIPQ